MFNNVETINGITNTNDKEVTTSPCYYMIGEVIAILNTMTDDATFSIFNKDSSYGCIWKQSHKRSIFTFAPDIREILG